MKLGTVKCVKCSQISVRNIHNKCIYCGHPFDKEHHVSETERTKRLGEIEATTERLKEGIELEKEREKRREREAKSRCSIDININNFN